MAGVANRLNPKGILAISPRLRRRSYLGNGFARIHNPIRGCGLDQTFSQGSSFLATLYSFSGVIHWRSRSALNPSATPPVNNAAAMWLFNYVFLALFSVGLRYEQQPSSPYELSPNFRPEPQPEHGYASSGDDDNVPFYTACAPRSLTKGTLA